MDGPARRRVLLTVAFTLFLDLAGFGIILPILPLYADDLGGSAIAVTLLSTTFSLAQFLMAPVLGSISDRKGRRPVMLISIAGSVAANLVLGFSTVLWLVFAARLVAGASKANVSTAFAYVSDTVEPAERARYMGLMGAALGLGFIVGPAMGGALAAGGDPTLPFFVSAGLSAVNWLMAWRWLPETRWARDPRAEHAGETDGEKVPEPRRLGLRQTLARISGTPIAAVIGVYFIFFAGFASMESTFALYYKAVYGWLETETAMFLTYIGVVMVLVQGLLIGRLVARFGESRTLVFGIFINALGLGALGGAPIVSALFDIPLVDADGGMTVFTGTMLALAGFGIAGGNGIVNAAMGSIVSQLSTSEEQGFNMGVRESAGSLARISGPVVAGPVFEYVHPGAPMLLGGVLGVFNFVAALALGRKLRAQGIR